MQNSLPARPSQEQLKKLAKDLVKDHAEKQPDALALIRQNLPALAGKTDAEIAAQPFALHDAQSVIARQHGFSSWNELSNYVEALQKRDPVELAPPLDVAGKLRTVLLAREKNDYTLFCSVMNGEMKSFVTKERFEATTERLSRYFKEAYRITYMGSVNRAGNPVYFWRLWVEGWDTDILVRMALNSAGLISGLLYSDPFDTGINVRK
jgi:hypothetical protein